MSVEAWQRGRLEAYMWHCGDTCDCTEPRVERITPNFKAGYPWVHRETLWSGTFHSEADHWEWRAQVAELRRACLRFDLPLPDWCEPWFRWHKDRTIRLHGGPSHGRIINISDEMRRSGYYLVPKPVDIKVWLFNDDASARPQLDVITYRRETLSVYDEVDDAHDVYDYWHVEGSPLPTVGRYPRS